MDILRPTDEKAHGLSNYTRTYTALQKLRKINGKPYVSTTHVPLVNGGLGISYERDDPGVVWDTSARLFAQNLGGLVVLRLSEFMNSDGLATKAGPLQFSKRLGVLPVTERFWDGYGVYISDDGNQQLFGIDAQREVTLGSINTAPADAFANSCLQPLENRATS